MKYFSARHELVLLSCSCLLLAALPAAGRDIKCDNAKEIAAALGSAGPGDTILVKPGEYDMGGQFSTGKSGTKDKPITLACDGKTGYAKLKSNGQIGFKIRSKHWIIRGIHIEGSTASTEATVFMDGPAGCEYILMTDCKISGSKQHGMKGARTRENAANNITVEHTELFDTAATGFDLVSGDNWVVRNNYVHDYGKGGGITYGIFLKGGGKNGIIDGNIVDAKRQATTVGISFGGGLTGHQWLPMVNGKIGAEHDGGVAQNNIVLNTSDVAYHSNNGANCKFFNNLAWNCKSFQRQASYPKDPVVSNNVIGGNTKNGASESADNMGPAKEWFVNADEQDFRLTEAGEKALSGKGKPAPEVTTDFFGNKRDPARHVLGPVLPGAKESTKWVDRRLAAAAGAAAAPKK